MSLNRGSTCPAELLLALMATAAFPALAVEKDALEEMVVTAEFREASLQETQISMNALSDDTIAELGISNGLDLGQYVANLNAQPFVGGRTGVSYNIRGIGNAETLITFDPAVSVYLDGVLIAKNTGSLLDVLELERIEVLRGPQGTLYGRNTMGGAVNYITKKPGDELEGSLKATFGSYEQRDFKGMINLPLLAADSAVGELNMRISAATLNRDGIQDNYLANAPNTELGTRDREVVMAQLMWRPIDAVSVLYSFDRTRIDEEQETPWVTIASPASPMAPYAQRESNRPDGGYFNSPHSAVTDVDGHALTITWNIADNLSLHSLTGYRDMENFGQADSDGTPINRIYTRDLQENESFSQEFRMIGTAMDDRLDYSTGLFYMEEDGDVFNETRINGGPGTNIAEYTNEAWAAYGQLTYAFTEKFNVTLGLRYTDEDREMEKAIVNGVVFDPIPFLDDIRATYAGNVCVPRPAPAVGLTCANTVFPSAHETFSKISPMISFGYNWTEDIMTYLKVSSGYQSGGFNARDAIWTDFVTGFDEEDLLAYELGLKATLAGRYQLNSAIWFSDYDDKRVNQFNPETLASVQRNAGKVEIWGIELEFLAQLTDNLQAGINYGYVDHEYKDYDFENANGSISDLSNSSNFPYSPENTASAFLAYEYPISYGILRARLDTTYRDEMTFLVPQPERNSSSSLQLWNARVSLDEIKGPGDSIVRVSAWGKNLTDEGYWNFGVNLFSAFAFDFNTYGEPRTVGVDVEIDF